jgi:hypothetical protein
MCRNYAWLGTFRHVTPTSCSFARLAPLALVVVLATACGDNGKGTATPTEPPGATTTSAGTTPVPTPERPRTPGKGTLTTASRDLLPLLGGSIKRFAPTQVEGKNLKVLAIVSPESFWAGRRSSQRILVTMRLKGRVAPTLKPGQGVDFIGSLTASPPDAATLAVMNDKDKKLLEKQGAFVNPSVADVKLR